MSERGLCEAGGWILAPESATYWRLIFSGRTITWRWTRSTFFTSTKHDERERDGIENLNIQDRLDLNQALVRLACMLRLNCVLIS